MDSNGLDLLENCLKIDHMERISAKDALKHRYFAKVRKRSGCELGSQSLNVAASCDNA